MDKNIQDTLNKDTRELLTDMMLKKVSGGGNDNPESVDCPNCGRTVWYTDRGRYAYECDCGWFSGRT